MAETLYIFYMRAQLPRITYKRLRSIRFSYQSHFQRMIQRGFNFMYSIHLVIFCDKRHFYTSACYYPPYLQFQSCSDFVIYLFRPFYEPNISTRLHYAFRSSICNRIKWKDSPHAFVTKYLLIMLELVTICVWFISTRI